MRGRIAAACGATGRDPASVVLIGASKKQPIEALLAAVEAGVPDLGENYVQEWQGKVDALGDAPIWHFIGHLQRNKAKHLAPRIDAVHGITDARTAEALGRRALALGRIVPVLLEVDLAGEASKSGLPADDVPRLLAETASLEGVQVQGLMTVPPDAGLADARRHFAALRRLRDALATAERPLPWLSMGMSGDFDAAIAEGATHVRVGTALFGPRPG
ncbi:MAG: YggS family pyridoxal phosphate-dependent enzyme [Myxococcales bacterium]|nr:YggS family pyridoxal phosphate-dependent enzyme [Myxococcales bacterium]